MEAMWSRFTPAYQKVLEEIKSGTIGTVLNVQANFGIPISNVERIWYNNIMLLYQLFRLQLLKILMIVVVYNNYCGTPSNI